MVPKSIHVHQIRSIEKAFSMKPYTQTLLRFWIYCSSSSPIPSKQKQLIIGSKPYSLPTICWKYNYFKPRLKEVDTLLIQIQSQATNSKNIFFCIISDDGYDHRKKIVALYPIKAIETYSGKYSRSGKDTRRTIASYITTV